MRELNFTQKVKTPREASGVTRIAVLVADLQDDVYPCILKGMTEIALRYQIVISLFDYNRSTQQETECIRAAASNGFDGIIAVLTGTSLNDEYRRLMERRYPIIFLKSPGNTIDCPDCNMISDDTYETFLYAIKYLVDLGHRDILVLSPQDEGGAFLSAHDDPARLRALDVNRELFCTCDNAWQPAFDFVTAKLRQSEASAICALTSTISWGAWCALMEMGCRVPQNCSFIGYGNQQIYQHLGMTTIEEPLAEIGRNAIYMMMEQLNDQFIAPQRLILPSRLAIRRSCMLRHNSSAISADNTVTLR